MRNICLDIGGTSIKGAFVTNSEIIKKFSVPTNGKNGLEDILKAIDSIMEMITSEFNDYDFIGISTAGNINPNLGVCVYASDNLKGYTGFNIKEYFETKYKHETIVENDAVSALYGELDKDEIDKNVFMITLGTGVGATLYQNHEVFYGSEFDLGKFAHHIIRENGYKCDCGKFGCAEKEISATGLKSLIYDTCGRDIDIKDLFDLYRRDDELATNILDIYFDKISKYIDYINTLSTDVIIIGGGLIGSQDVFRKFIKDKKVRYAKHGNDAGIIGINYKIQRTKI